MANLNARKIFGEWITYDHKKRNTWCPIGQEIIVQIRTPYKNADGTPFYYCPKAMRIKPNLLRNLCVPEGRKGAYIETCRVVRWRYLDERGN